MASDLARHVPKPTCLTFMTWSCLPTGTICQSLGMVKEVKREFYEERQVQPMIGEGFIRDDTVDGQNPASQLFYC